MGKVCCVTPHTPRAARYEHSRPSSDFVQTPKLGVRFFSSQEHSIFDTAQVKRKERIPSDLGGFVFDAVE